MADISLDDEFLPRGEVADLLGLTPKTLREMERNGSGPEVVRVSPRRALYPREGILRFLQSRVRGGAAPQSREGR